jgi:hypothetical protein
LATGFGIFFRRSLISLAAHAAASRQRFQYRHGGRSLPAKNILFFTKSGWQLRAESLISISLSVRMKSHQKIGSDL